MLTPHLYLKMPAFPWITDWLVSLWSDISDGLKKSYDFCRLSVFYMVSRNQKSCILICIVIYFLLKHCLLYIFISILYIRKLSCSKFTSLPNIIQLLNDKNTSLDFKINSLYRFGFALGQKITKCKANAMIFYHNPQCHLASWSLYRISWSEYVSSPPTFGGDNEKLRWATEARHKWLYAV